MAQNKKLETLLYSGLGVLGVAVVLVALNFILGLAKTRVDLTAEKLYTLTPGTKAILKKLDTPVKIRLYYTQSEAMMPVPLKTYAMRVEDLLGEYKQLAKGNLEIEKFDPQPDSDAEDSANLDGVEGQTLQNGEKIYLGLSISCLDQKVAVPFLSPDRERLLEYDLSRAIASIARPEKPVIGVMSSLPVFGQPANPMMMRMGQPGGGQPAWIFIGELKRDFTVKQVEATAEKIDDDIKVLVVVHPKNLAESAQFAIDQFVLRGGKLVAFLDPMSTVDSQGQNPMMGMQGPSASSLGKLTEAWGIQFDTTKVVADMNFKSRIFRGEADRPQVAPAVLSLTEQGVDKDDVTTQQIDSLTLWFAGAFTGTPAEGLKQTVLLKSTTDSMLADAFMAQMSGEQIAKDFKPSGKEYPLAIRLAGKFKTAFPNGKPESKPAEGEKPEEKKPEAKKDDALKVSKQDGMVVLVGDSDVLYDRYGAEVQNFMGQQIVQMRNGNLPFVQALIEHASGDSDLINVRSRATMTRPFTLVRQMEAQAEDRFRGKIAELEKSLQETQTRLNELQRNKEKGQRFVLSPEQKAEIEKFRKQEATAKQEIKLLNRELHRDMESLQTKLKLINIFVMPAVVIFAGLAVFVLKRNRTAAK
ncbi:MAG: Gldg family protein [Verrucomicrobia bacterium]|nr:Gldg family protein [Verrucomicrobiota bacterium]